MEVIEKDEPLMVGSRLQKLRKIHGISQAEFGRILELTPSAIGQYEIGVSNPKLETLLKICKIYSVNLEWLVNGNGEMTEKKSSKDGSTVKVAEATALSDDTVLRLKEELQRERTEREREQAEKKALLEQNAKLLELLGKQSGELLQRIAA